MLLSEDNSCRANRYPLCNIPFMLSIPYNCCYIIYISHFLKKRIGKKSIQISQKSTLQNEICNPQHDLFRRVGSI